VGCWRGYLSGAKCRLAYGPADATGHSLSLASVKSRLVLPFWYRLTRVVPAVKRVCVCIITFELSVLDLLVELGDEALYAVVSAVGHEVSEVDRLLAMRLRSRH